MPGVCFIEVVNKDNEGLKADSLREDIVLRVTY